MAFSIGQMKPEDLAAISPQQLQLMLGMGILKDDPVQLGEIHDIPSGITAGFNALMQGLQKRENSTMRDKILGGMIQQGKNLDATSANNATFLRNLSGGRTATPASSVTAPATAKTTPPAKIASNSAPLSGMPTTAGIPGVTAPLAGSDPKKAMTIGEGISTAPPKNLPAFKPAQAPAAATTTPAPAAPATVSQTAPPAAAISHPDLTPQETDGTPAGNAKETARLEDAKARAAASPSSTPAAPPVPGVEKPTTFAQPSKLAGPVPPPAVSAGGDPSTLAPVPQGQPAVASPASPVPAAPTQVDLQARSSAMFGRGAVPTPAPQAPAAVPELPIARDTLPPQQAASQAALPPHDPSSGFKPSHLVLHDYGGTPKNQDGVFNPYHSLVFPDGSIRYRNPENPYGQRAPHAYQFNPHSIGLSYAGNVGSEPTPEAMTTLKNEYASIKKLFPDIQPLGHGEAYAMTKGTSQQASKNGRDLIEAQWRKNLSGEQPTQQADASFGQMPELSGGTPASNMPMLDPGKSGFKSNMPMLDPGKSGFKSNMPMIGTGFAPPSGLGGPKPVQVAQAAAGPISDAGTPAAPTIGSGFKTLKVQTQAISPSVGTSGAQMPAPARPAAPQENPVATKSPIMTPAQFNQARVDFSLSPEMISMQRLDPARYKAEMDRFDMLAPQTGKPQVVGDELVQQDPDGTVRSLYRSDKPTGEMQNYETYRKQELQDGRAPKSFNDWNIAMKQAGVAQPEDQFSTAMAKDQAQRFSGMITAGDTARGFRQTLDVLREHSTNIGDTGVGGQLAMALSPVLTTLGLRPENMSDMEAFNSIIQKVAPTMRAAGSGSTSDIEFKGFLQALPSLIGTTDGRELVINQLSALAEDAENRAEVASMVASGEVSRKNADSILKKLPNPLTMYHQYNQRSSQGGAPGAVTDSVRPGDVPPQAGQPQLKKPPQQVQLKVGQTATGPNGQKLHWDGKGWAADAPKPQVEHPSSVQNAPSRPEGITPAPWESDWEFGKTPLGGLLGFGKKKPAPTIGASQ